MVIKGAMCGWVMVHLHRSVVPPSVSLSLRIVCCFCGRHSQPFQGGKMQQMRAIITMYKIKSYSLSAPSQVNNPGEA
ncbi:hypothetical protein niasHT_037484 [Heterodera trifolii]|uniref:Secreted protein n=1 Tax=Heterodera trifolii TaxID=157864 RepID=A0ABD2IP94_9BILA